MATASIAISLEAHEGLSEIYLMLWRQLDSLTGESRCLQIQPRPDGTLLDEINARIAMMAPHPSSVLFADFKKTQEFVENSAALDSGGQAAFRDYLRDQGLRHAELADQIWVIPQ